MGFARDYVCASFTMAMVVVKEATKCTDMRLFLWNEKLTRNQISESEGLCVILIRRKYTGFYPCQCGNSFCKGSGNSCCPTVIPFDLSRLLNKDPSLFPMLLCATLQFLPQNITQMANHISSYFFTQFQFPQRKRPPYVIVLEIFHILSIDYTSDDSVSLVDLPRRPPPPIPSFCRFEKDWDEEEELLTSVRSVSTTDYMNDPYHRYFDDVLEYIYALREYTGEAGICPTRPPIAANIPKGLVELGPSLGLIRHQLNDSSRDLMDDTCPVCCADFEDKNEVITTNCSHDFHTGCLLSWLLEKNTCPTCRAVYPLHYSPSSNCRKRREHNSILEANGLLISSRGLRLWLG